MKRRLGVSTVNNVLKRGTLKVLEWPNPPVHPWTAITTSPELIKPRSIPCFIPHARRRSTSSCHKAESVGLGLGYRQGYTPRKRWAERHVLGFLVTVMIGTEGRYLEQRRAVSPLLLDRTRKGLRCGDDNDGFGILFERCRNSSTADGFGSFGGRWCECSQFVEEGWVKDCGFCEKSSFVHHGNRFKRICALCSFTRQHDTISTIEDCVADIRNLGPSRSGIVRHRLEHLCCTAISRIREDLPNDGFPSEVAPSNHTFLCDKDLRCRNFNTQISSCNHNSICLLENLIEIVDTLLILNF